MVSRVGSKRVESFSSEEKSSVPIPNFFIVGAPRTGTTSVWSYLVHHPDVFMSYQKEPLYFGSDLTKTPHEFAVLEKNKYLELFRKGGSHRIRGEASVMYLFSKTAAREIYEFNPDARILIMLRNPVDVIYSHHGQLRWGGYEDLADFGEALDAEADRRQDRRVPKSALVKQALFYREIGLFGQQVERYLQVFPHNQVKVILYEEFCKAPEKNYFSLLDFLGLREIPPPSYEIKNPHKEPRSIRLSAWLHKPPGALGPVLRLIPQPYRHRLLWTLFILINTRYRKRDPLDPELRRRLEDYYTPDTQKLSLLIGRDLSGWTGQKTPAPQVATVNDVVLSSKVSRWSPREEPQETS